MAQLFLYIEYSYLLFIVYIVITLFICKIRKIDYYVNDPYVTIIDIRLKEKYVYSRIKGAIHYEYNKLVDDINNIYKCGKISYEFRKIFGNKEKIYIFYCDKGAMSLVICEKMSGLGYICKTVVGGFEAYKGMCVIN